VTPLARYFADSLIGYLIDLERPNRSAAQANLVSIARSKPTAFQAVSFEPG